MLIFSGKCIYINIVYGICLMQTQFVEIYLGVQNTQAMLFSGKCIYISIVYGICLIQTQFVEIY